MDILETSLKIEKKVSKRRLATSPAIVLFTFFQLLRFPIRMFVYFVFLCFPFIHNRAKLWYCFLCLSIVFVLNNFCFFNFGFLFFCFRLSFVFFTNVFASYVIFSWRSIFLYLCFFISILFLLFSIFLLKPKKKVNQTLWLSISRFFFSLVH